MAYILFTKWFRFFFMAMALLVSVSCNNDPTDPDGDGVNLIDPAAVPPGVTYYQFASPNYYIKNGSTPTIAFYGSTDNIVPITEQKTRLDAKLTQYNVPHEMHVWNGDHNAFAVDPQLSDILSKSKAFLDKYNP